MSAPTPTDPSQLFRERCRVCERVIAGASTDRVTGRYGVGGFICGSCPASAPIRLGQPAASDKRWTAEEVLLAVFAVVIAGAILYILCFTKSYRYGGGN